jgi:hypothetical protein
LPQPLANAQLTIGYQNSCHRRSSSARDAVHVAVPPGLAQTEAAAACALRAIRYFRLPTVVP